MNWVGGSRNRILMKNDAKKQKEFFEKRKMQQKLKNRGISLPQTPQGTTSGSLDLVTLFIVNQIASKKENTDPPKVATLGSSKRGSKQQKNETLVLPMSPCSPSQLNLVEGQTQSSSQGKRKREHVIPQGFKCRQLSPVLESAFSDISASDYMPPMNDLISPFSSISPASPGPGMLPLHRGNLSPAQIPSHGSFSSWDTSGLEPTKFRPFSQPRGMTDSLPWSYGSSPALCHLETPTPAQVLFGCPEPDMSEAFDHAEHDETFSFNQPEDSEPLLGFSLPQAEPEQHCEEDFFRGFSTDCDTEASHDWGGYPKIYLRDGLTANSSTPQTVPDSEHVEVELSHCCHKNSSLLQVNNSPVGCCGCCDPHPFARGYLSSDSEDDEEGSQSSINTPSLYLGQSCCFNIQHPDMGSQGKPKEMLTNPTPGTTLLKPFINAFQEEGITGHLTGGSTVGFETCHALGLTKRCEPCKCTKTNTQDAGTQTDSDPALEKSDASTQCDAVEQSATKPSAFNLAVPKVTMRGQADAAAAPNIPVNQSGKEKMEEKQTPRRKKTCRASLPSGKIPVITFLAENSDGGDRRRAMKSSDGPGKKKRESRDGEGREEFVPLITEPANQVKAEVTPANQVHRFSKETETLQEIADILLMLRQRKEDK